jgi:hypothetical protein
MRGFDPSDYLLKEFGEMFHLWKDLRTVKMFDDY